MPMMPPVHRAPGYRSGAARKAEADARRGSARARGYTLKWDKASAGHLKANPLCVYCEMGAWGEPPRVEAAVLTDHLIPHRGDQAVFWNRRDWVACCAACHSGPKQRAEQFSGEMARLVNAVRAYLAAPRGWVESLQPGNAGPAG